MPNLRGRSPVVFAGLRRQGLGSLLIFLRSWVVRCADTCSNSTPCVCTLFTNKFLRIEACPASIWAVSLRSSNAMANSSALQLGCKRPPGRSLYLWTIDRLHSPIMKSQVASSKIASRLASSMSTLNIFHE